MVRCNLVIDFGNTHTKGAIFEGDILIKKFDQIQPDEINKIKQQYLPKHIIASTTSLSEIEIKKIIGPETLILNHKLKFPFKIKYKTPETLGLDRIAAIAGVNYLHKNKHCLVIDAGTCITYDLIEGSGNYLGGGISPGINMRFKSLHTFTANLPLVNTTENTSLIGQTTKKAIESGVIYGVLGEIKEIIRMYSDKYANLQIITCGGDARYLKNKLDRAVIYSPELVLTGLNRILLHNV